MVHIDSADEHLDGAETAYACFYNGKLLPPNDDEGEADGHCCLCCYFKQTIKPPDYEVLPQAPWEKNPNAGGEPNFKGCYCTCCPCWPDSSLHFEMKETAVSFDDGATFIPAVAENWDHILKHENKAGAGSNCFQTQYHGWQKAGEGGMWRCGSAAASSYNQGGEYEDSCVAAANVVPTQDDVGPHADGTAYRESYEPYLNPEDIEGLLDTCIKYQDERMYPEAWGYRGNICKDSHYKSTRPALITESPGNDTDECGGMGIISTLCCCKTGGGADPDQPEGVALPDCYNRCPLPGGGPYCPGKVPEYHSQWSHLGSLDETVLSPAGNEGTWKHNYQDNYTCESHCFSYCLMPDPTYDMRFSLGAQYNWKGMDCNPVGTIPDGTVKWLQTVAGHNTSITTTSVSRCVNKSVDIHPQKDYVPSDPTVAFEGDLPGPYCIPDKPDGTNVYPGANTYTFNEDFPYRYFIGEFKPQTPDAMGDRDFSGHTKIIHAQCGGGEGGKFAMTVAGECVIHADCQTGTLPCYDTSSSNCAPEQSDTVVCPKCGTLGHPGPHDCCKGEAAGRAPLPDGVDNLLKQVGVVFWKTVNNVEVLANSADPEDGQSNFFFTIDGWPPALPPPTLGSLKGMSVHNVGRLAGVLGPPDPGDPEDSWAEITDHDHNRRPTSPGSIKIETTNLTKSIREGKYKNSYCIGDRVEIWNKNGPCNYGFMNVKGLCWPSSDQFIGPVVMRWTGVIEEM